MRIIEKAAAICLLVVTFSSHQAFAIEKPEYSVLFKDGKIEYRLYQPYIVAETEVSTEQDYGRASNEGFMRLFGYISGDNYKQSDIAMTAPVQRSRIEAEIDMTAPVQQAETDDGWRVAFMLPSKYDMDNAPIPTDDRVTLRQIPEKKVASIRFSGRWTEKNFDKYSNQLLAAIAEEGITVVGEPESAAYNPPFMPPFLRRNEILIEVDATPQAAN